MSPEQWRAAFDGSAGSLANQGFPQIVCGWPFDAYECLNHRTYLDYVMELWVDFIDAYLDDVPDGRDVPCVSSGPVLPAPPTFRDWQRAEAEKHPDRDDLGVEWRECDLCGALPGERHAATALPADPATNADYVKLSVCPDCLCYIANGDEPNFD